MIEPILESDFLHALAVIAFLKMQINKQWDFNLVLKWQINKIKIKINKYINKNHITNHKK